MIGDVIGKPGRVALEQTLPDAARRARHRLRHRQRREPRRRHGPDGLHRARRCSTPASTSSPAATTSGTSARSTPSWTATSASCGRSTTAARRPGRGWGIFHALDGTEVAVINAQGRTYMQPIENPFTMLDRLLDEGAEPLPPVRLVDFHCELTQREERVRPPPRRARQRRRAAPTPTSPRPTSGSCRAARPTSATSA